MTGLESILGGGVLALGMFITGRISNRRVVNKEICENTHHSLASLLEEKFETLNRRLDKIDLKLDK